MEKKKKTKIQKWDEVGGAVEYSHSKRDFAD